MKVSPADPDRQPGDHRIDSGLPKGGEQMPPMLDDEPSHHADEQSRRAIEDDLPGIELFGQPHQRAAEAPAQGPDRREHHARAVIDPPGLRHKRRILCRQIIAPMNNAKTAAIDKGRPSGPKLWNAQPPSSAPNIAPSPQTVAKDDVPATSSLPEKRSPSSDKATV